MAPVLASALSAQPLDTARAAGNLQLASNEQLLQLWAQATQSAPPEIVRTDDGGSRIEWRAAAAADVYHNSSSGGLVNTPMRDGTFHRIQVNSDLRVLEPGNRLNWFLFGMTGSNDRSVMTQTSLINSLQFGRTGEGFRVALGDVPVNFSSLGASAGLRGAIGERYLGQTLVQGAFGMVAQTWESLFDKGKRNLYTRDAYALKIQHPLTDKVSVFLSTQGYSDNETSVNPGITPLAPVEGRSTTAGFSFRHGQFSLTGEAGFSNWKEIGIQEQDDTAWVLDGVWQGERGQIRLGYHDFGLYYTSLSAMAMPGIREAYVDGNWFAADGLGLNAGLRRTTNRRAMPVANPAGIPVTVTANAVDTDAWLLGANLALKQFQGASVSLNASGSNGENGDGSGNTQLNGSARLNYSRDGWSSGIGYTGSKIDNRGAAAASGKTNGWDVMLGRQWSDTVAATWQFGASATYRDQRQALDSGARTTRQDWSLGVNGSHIRWGRFDAGYYGGQTRDPYASQNLDSSTWKLSAERSFTPNASLKLYFFDSRRYHESAALSTREQQFGVQLALQN